MIKQSGLDEILKSILESKTSKIPLSRIISGSTIRNILSTSFDPFLCSINFEVSNHLQYLISSKLCKMVTNQSVTKFIQDYNEIVHCILDANNGFEFPRTNVLLRSIEEVETVIGVSFPKFSEQVNK